MQKNKLTMSRPGLSLYDISASNDFGNTPNLGQGCNNRTIVTKNVSVTQLNTVNLNPDPSKGIKASIGGEEFVMYRTSDIKGLNLQGCQQTDNDDNDSVEIEMQDDEDFIHHTMKQNQNVMKKNKILGMPIHQRKASRDIEYIELDTFEEYEEKLEHFL